MMEGAMLSLGEDLRRGIREGSFMRLMETGALDHLRWLGPLREQARCFTQLLSLRAALSTSRFRDAFAEHAAEESAHPVELDQWIESNEITLGPQSLRDPADLATRMNVAFMAHVTLFEPDEVKVGVMNVLSEGIALDFYTAVIPRLDRLGLLRGRGSRYWRTHRAVDGDHLRIGLSLCADIPVDSPQAKRVFESMAASAALYGGMLESWAQT